MKKSTGFSKIVMCIPLIIGLVGCSSLDSKKYVAADKIKVVDLSFMSAGNTQSCEKLGTVNGNSVGELGGKKAALKHMKVNADKLKANIIVSSLQFEKTAGLFAPAESITGIAFKCREEIYSKTATVDDVFAL